MRRIWILIFWISLAAGARAQETYVPAPENREAREDFRDRKFGMFIHWGIYSLLGDGEWVMHNRKIPYASYSRLASFFYPYAFDAKAWVGLAKAAGMKYITITSRHHDGFSMFSTKASPYNIVDATPWHQDPMKALAEECHRQGIKLFFYYSLLDWGRSDYGFGDSIVNGKPQGADWDHYIAFMKQQLTELLTQYGPIGGIWFDGEWERKTADWHLDEIYALIHRLQPAAMIGNNHHHAPRPGEDFQMFEKDLPGGNSHGWNSGGVSEDLPLETCETMNNAWGFNINDLHFKSVAQIIHLLVRDAGHNANLLLNVGPMPNGKIQPEFVDTLQAVGRWIARYGSTIYGTRQGFLPPQKWGVTTAKGNTQFIHVLEPPAGDTLQLTGVARRVMSAVDFATRREIPFRQTPAGVQLAIGTAPGGTIDRVIELKLAERRVKIPPRGKWIMKK